MLLAAFCFSRSHPEWHQRLRNSRSFGRMVRDWEERGAISLKARLLATSVMAALAVWLWAWGAPPWPVKALTMAAQAGVLAFIWTRPP